MIRPADGYLIRLVNEIPVTATTSGHQFLPARLPRWRSIEDSTAWPAVRTSTISTGAPLLDRLLAGAGFLGAVTYPEISFRSELPAWVPAGRLLPHPCRPAAGSSTRGG
jgi:hypothetical protein